MTYNVKFYERTDAGKRRVLKTVPVTADSPSLVAPMQWALMVLQGTKDARLLSRVVEIRVSLVEVPAPVPTPTLGVAR